MTDIVERLRTAAAYVDDGWITHTGEHGHRLLKEAADEIERLRAAVHTAFNLGLNRGLAEKQLWEPSSQAGSQAHDAQWQGDLRLLICQVV